MMSSLYLIDYLWYNIMLFRAKSLELLRQQELTGPVTLSLVTRTDARACIHVRRRGATSVHQRGIYLQTFMC